MNNEMRNPYYHVSVTRAGDTRHTFLLRTSLLIMCSGIPYHWKNGGVLHAFSDITVIIVLEVTHWFLKSVHSKCSMLM